MNWANQMDIFCFAGNYVLFDFTRLGISKIIKMLILASLENYPSYLQQTYMKLNFHSNYSVCLNNVSSSILCWFIANYSIFIVPICARW